MKLALTLSLALAACLWAQTSEAAAADPWPDGAGLAAVDGAARRVTRRGVRRGRDRTRLVPVRATSGPGPQRALSAASTRVVTEIDAEGLKKLLQRGPDAETARPLLVNFWATWCDPCREEFPDLVKIDTEFRPRGLDFVTVSADDVSEIKTGVPSFLKKMNATMPSYILNAPDVEAAMGLVDPKWGGELPATFLLDREGKIVFKHFGRVKLAELRPALEKVLGGK